MFPSDITERVEEYGLSHTADTGNAKKPVGRTGTILQRLDKIIENLVSTNELGGIHPGRRLERIDARHDTSPSAVGDI